MKTPRHLRFPGFPPMDKSKGSASDSPPEIVADAAAPSKDDELLKKQIEEEKNLREKIEKESKEKENKLTKEIEKI